MSLPVNIGFSWAITLATIITAIFIYFPGKVYARDHTTDTTSSVQQLQAISYQGILSDVDGVVLPDGEYTITFVFYDAPEGGSEVWKESQPVRLEHGEFTAVLGSVHPLTTSFAQSRWLAVSVNGSDAAASRTEFLVPTGDLDRR